MAQIEKHRVCTRCLSVDIVDPNCMCCIGKFETIELEFDTCEHCGSTSDQPIDSEFNDKQLTKLHNGTTKKSK